MIRSRTARTSVFMKSLTSLSWDCATGYFNLVHVNSTKSGQYFPEVAKLSVKNFGVCWIVISLVNSSKNNDKAWL